MAVAVAVGDAVGDAVAVVAGAGSAGSRAAVDSTAGEGRAAHPASAKRRNAEVILPPMGAR